MGAIWANEVFTIRVSIFHAANRAGWDRLRCHV
jgi:hypothetical protein